MKQEGIIVSQLVVLIYSDKAYFYQPDSKNLVGEVVKEYPREQIKIATKRVS